MIPKNLTNLLLAVFTAFGLATVASSANANSGYIYIVHKATGKKVSTCGPIGEKVAMVDTTATDDCAKWEKVPTGNYFYLRSVAADGYIRPRGLSNGIPIMVQPTSWTGNYMQWSTVETGDGYFHLVNRQTKKFGYSTGDTFLQESKNWKGDWTRWKFEDVDPSVNEPNISIVSPVQNAEYSVGSNITITYNYSGFDFVDNIHVHTTINGGSQQSHHDDRPITISNLPVGTHVIRVIKTNADDTNSNVYDEVTVNIVDDTMPPAMAVNITSPSNNTSYEVGNTVSVAFNVTGVTLANESYHIHSYVDGGNKQTHYSTAPIPFSNLSVGTHTIKLVLANPDHSETDKVAQVVVVIQQKDVPPPSGDRGEFGIDADGTLYHADGGQSAGWAYLCFNGPCADAKGGYNNGYYEMPVNVEVGGTYSIEFKVQDDQKGQCLSGIKTVTFTEEGVTADSDCVVPDETAPTVPTNLDGKAKNGDALELTWKASTDDRRVAYYNVYKDGTFEKKVSGNAASISGLTELTTYSFQVNACDSAENCSSNSATKQMTTPEYVEDTFPPTVPTGLVATAESMTKILLSWTASTDAEGVVTDYKVYADGKLLSVVDETTFLVTDLEKSTAYSFEVSACDNKFNCSDTSPAETGKTLAPDFSFLDWTSNSFVTGKPAGPLPRSNPIRALRTPVNGIAARTYGFAFDLQGGNVSWRWGSSIPKREGDSGLEVSCSEDNHHTFKTAKFSGGNATMPCSGTYDYFFRYLHPHSLNSDPAHAWIYTGLFTTEGSRIDPYAPGAYSFTDGTANWARIRHPITTDGITAAVLDRPNAGERLRNLDRYTMWVDDSSGFVDFNMDVSYMNAGDEGVPSDVVPGFRRNEALRASHGSPNAQQFFAINTASKFGSDYRTAPQSELEGFGDTFSYGQVISFEFSIEAAGKTPAQTYNDFSHYIVGCGFCGKYGDPRLNSAGKASTSQVFSDKGQYIDLERNAIFTQPVTTLNTEVQIDNFILGHHLFHGIDPNVSNPNGETRNKFGHVKIGEFACGDCHWRDGRSYEYFQTPRGQRIAPPTYGVKLLESIEGREVGFRWDGGAWTVEDQAKNALHDDHKVDWKDLPPDAFRRIINYVEVLTVPARTPGTYDDPAVAQGEVLFTNIGCADCHTPVQHTSSSAEPAWANLTIRPYTDMKVWNLGTAGSDQMDTSYRTAPLWGLGQNIKLAGYNDHDMLYMHDGESRTIDDAIQRHNIDGAYTKDAFNALNASQKEAVIKFVESL